MDCSGSEQIVLTVKVLNGQELQLKVSPDYHIHEVLNMLTEIIGMPSNQLRLINKGKVLQESLTLKDYKIKHGSKLTLLSSSANKQGQSTTSTTNQSTSVKQIKKETTPTFWKDLESFLAKHFTTQDAVKVLAIFQQRYKDVLQQISLDDVERIAKGTLAQDTTT